MRDGTYDLVGGVIKAIRAPGVTQQKVEAFRDLVEAVNSGKTTQEDAAKQIDALSGYFYELWVWLGANGAQLATLITILSLVINIYYGQMAKEGGSEAHNAAARQHTDYAQQHFDADRRHQDDEDLLLIQQKIYSELLNQQSPGQSQEGAIFRSERHLSSVPEKRSTTETVMNRHERRKQAKISGHRPIRRP
jgi:hypothetical protein